MNANEKLVQGWLLKAESDFSTVHILIEADGPFDTACFHLQQTIEKLLKAFLVFHGKPIPKIYDLEELQRQCILIEPLTELEQLDFSQITDFAVEMRYDIEFWPNLQDVQDALNIVDQVRKFIYVKIPERCHPKQPNQNML